MLPLHYVPFIPILVELSLLVNFLVWYTNIIMIGKKILEQLNIIKQCRKYSLSVWQCPQFLFLIMGIIIIVSSLLTYAIGNRYIEDPLLVALIVIAISIVLLIIATTITRNFEVLAETNRMKSEFVSIVSHQLRSPLSNLKWVIEILMSGKVCPVAEKQTEYFRILKENSKRMDELVSDLLTVSRIEQGRLPLQKEKTSFKDLVEKIIKETEILAKASNVEVEFNPVDSLPEIVFDPSQVKLVVTNLLENAIRYAKAKGNVKIGLKKKNSKLYFEVKDNGVGIPEKDQKYIFQRFFRSENAKKRQTEGSGLGLYIAKSIVEKSGGKIGFSSRENKGSTFWFTLPIK